MEKENKIVLPANFSLMLLLLLFFTVCAKTGGDPGNGSGGSFPNAASIGGVISPLVKTNNGLVHELIGQAIYQIPLAGISALSGLNVVTKLTYNSLYTDKRADSINEVALNGWVGLGWNLGFYYIRVDNNNTPDDSSDDKWYFGYGDGSESQIVSVHNYVTNANSWTVKNNPFWIITPHYCSSQVNGSFGTNNICSLTVATETGTQLIFENPWYYQYETNNGNKSFWYLFRWDLSHMRDVNGDDISFNYETEPGSYTGVSGNALNYYQPSYLTSIQSNNGDALYFDLGNKNAAEGRSSSINALDFLERKYLDQIRITRNNQGLDTIKFSYSFINSGVPGKEKRLLISPRFCDSPEMNLYSAKF
jgi:hypothetical protein